MLSSCNKKKGVEANDFFVLTSRPGSHFSRFSHKFVGLLLFSYVGIFEEEEKLVEGVDGQEEVQNQNGHIRALLLLTK